MRNLLIVSGVALAIVVGITIYASTILGRFQDRERHLNEEYVERADDLRALDRLFPGEPPKELDPARWPAYLSIRETVTKEFVTREKEPESNTHFHARQTRNDMLRILRKALEEQRLSLSWYIATGRRWQALLALGEPKDLRAAWDVEVRTPKHPEGEPLPPPAKEARTAELDLFRKSAPRLQRTLDADLMLPLLEKIRDGS